MSTPRIPALPIPEAPVRPDLDVLLTRPLHERFYLAGLLTVRIERDLLTTTQFKLRQTWGKDDNGFINSFITYAAECLAPQDVTTALEDCQRAFGSKR